jgi:hypothetical protein
MSTETVAGSPPAARACAHHDDTGNATEGVAPQPGAGPGLQEVLAIWALCAALLLVTFVTYLRTPVAKLYHSSQGGLAGAASSVLVVVNYPIAIIATALTAIVVARLLAHPWAASPVRRWGVISSALVAVAMCAVAAWPGVVSTDEIHVTPINAVPAAGAGLALLLTTLGVWVSGAGRARPVGRADAIRVALAAGLVVAALPWLVADLGFYIGDVPVLGRLFMSKQIFPEADGLLLPAVHVGRHHGADGALFAVSALLLSRTLLQIPGARLRSVLCFALSLMFVYGVANFAQDFWTEQVVKRGWSTHSLSNMVVPAVRPAWGVIVIATVALYLVYLRGLRRALERVRPPAKPRT